MPYGENMKLNRVERVLMNNPGRAAMQRHFEAPILERIGGRLVGQRVLEVGCGRGVGVEVLFKRFGAAEVYAFDLDAAMARVARRRIQVSGRQAWITVADAVAIPVRTGAFDAVMDFGAVHHIPNWRLAIAEIGRVLRPGGRFYFMEITRQSLDRWVVRQLLDHPLEDRFDREAFQAELERNGLQLERRIERRWLGDMILGVGRRQGGAVVGRP